MLDALMLTIENVQTCHLALHGYVPVAPFLHQPEEVPNMVIEQFLNTPANQGRMLCLSYLKSKSVSFILFNC